MALFLSKMKTNVEKFFGARSEADQIREKKFKLLAGSRWYDPPDRLCWTAEPIHPRLLGRFYGENNIRKCAIEVRKINKDIALRCVWQVRSRHTWAKKTNERYKNQYYALKVAGPQIGNSSDLMFRIGGDGRYYMGYKHFMEVVMKKI